MNRDAECVSKIPRTMKQFLTEEFSLASDLSWLHKASIQMGKEREREIKICLKIEIKIKNKGKLLDIWKQSI